MEFDEAKENIQPLAQGRNAIMLQASLKVESPQDLLRQRKELEKEIHQYVGEDPLEPWYSYISWIEQCFPSAGKESGLHEVLAKCLSRFENSDQYYQDRRMVKLYIKFIESHKNPAECYQQLYNAGIGTMVADFYIAWAYYHDMVGNTRKADEVFRIGISCKAQPFEELQEAHQHFGFTVAQRLMYKDDDGVREETNRQISERRMALTSLKVHRRKQQVGSIRTGAAIKSILPGTVQSDGPSTSTQRCNNTQVQIYRDENTKPNVIVIPPATITEEVKQPEESSGASVVRSIIDTAREQENNKEPGPWSKAHIGQKKGKLFSKNAHHELGFEIHSDEDATEGRLLTPIICNDTKFDKPFICPKNYFNRSKPQREWNTPVTTEEVPDKQRCIPHYPKCKLYPRPNKDLQLEELKAYHFLKRRNMKNVKFTDRCSEYFESGPQYNLRLYPNFAKHVKNENTTESLPIFIPARVNGLVIRYDEVYNEAENIERSFEEIMAMRIKRNETIMTTADMEMTVCASSERVQRRKSFFPMRKSMALIRRTVCHTLTEQVEEPSAIFTAAEMATNNQCIKLFSSAEKKESTESGEFKIPTAKPIVSIVGKDHHQPTAEIQQKTHLTIFKTEGNTIPESDCDKVAVLAAISSAAKVHFNVSQDDSPSSSKSKSVCETEQSKNITEQQPDQCISSTAKSHLQIFETDVAAQPARLISPKPQKSMESDPFKIPALPAAKTTHFEEDASFASVLAAAPPAFKTPAVKSMQFNIFEDEAVPANVPKINIATSCADAGGGGFFDADESCSTQQFNIFIKAQSVSTPKAIAKTQPRQLLKDVLTLPQTSSPSGHAELMETSPKAEEVAPEKKLQPLSEQNDENSPMTVTQYSPQRKQLSTILETSEHATTQGTTQHTTGTTKSTISSPEYEQDVGAVQMSSNSAKREASAAATKVSFSTNEDADLKTVSHDTKTLTPDTSSTMRLEGVLKPKTNVFEIFTDSLAESKQQVGNISRLLENKEMISNSTMYLPTQPVKFQEDKTETIPNVLYMAAGSQPLKFQEDKTETISRFMMMNAPQPIKFQEDKTETIPNVLCMPAPEPLKFQEDKTDTLSKFIMTNAPQPMKYQEDKSDTLSRIVMKSPSPPKQRAVVKSPFEISQNKNDLFKFFAQSPPLKGTRKFLQTQQDANSKRTASEARTPVAFSSDKRVCDQNTPQLMQPMALFEDEMQSVSASNSSTKAQPTKATKSALQDSFMPDFSIIENSQPLQSKKPTMKSALRDSFLPEYSLAEKIAASSQNQLDFEYIPQTQQPTHVIDKERLEEDIKAFQQQSKNILQSSNLKDSFLSNFTSNVQQQPAHSGPNNINFSHIPETQPTTIPAIDKDQLEQDIMNFQQSKQFYDSKKHNAMKDSFLPEFSLTENQRPKQTTHQEEINKQKSFEFSFVIPETQEVIYIDDNDKPHHSRNFSDSRNEQQQICLNSAENQQQVQGTMTASEENLNKQSFIRSFRDTSFAHESTRIPQKQAQVTSSATASKESRPSLRKHLMDTFMKDMSDGKNPQMQAATKESNPIATTGKRSGEIASTVQKLKKLSFLPYQTDNNKCAENNYFELNAETEMFGTNISMIKNSTWLPNHGPRNSIPKQLSQIQENSFHIKDEPLSLQQNSNASQQNTMTNVSKQSKLISMQDTQKISFSASRLSIDMSASEIAALKKAKAKSAATQNMPDADDNDDDDDNEMSIYYKHTPKTPKNVQIHVWQDDDDQSSDSMRPPPGNNRFTHTICDLNQTQQVIENICVDPNVNPFNSELITAFLDQINFTSFVEDLPSCQLVGRIHCLQPTNTIKVNDVKFNVLKIIGEGSYGAVYKGIQVSNGKHVALKQEKPPNYWEYYICLEIQDRLCIDEMLPAFMHVDFALIGNNSSILISNFSTFGSLIAVCNKIKKITLKNVDEYVVMVMACELLEIMDHLHAINIIHADVKADNFLIMKKLSYPHVERSLQLIDFGVSIDMKLFKKGQTFSYVHNDNTFKCVEMREGKSWTYQIDLYGLAGVLHVLLFGRYMDVEKKPNGIWMHKTHVPRYINRELWGTVFTSLLNIRDCNAMPNLQKLRTVIKEEMVEKEKYVLKMVNEFNKALSS